MISHLISAKNDFEEKIRKCDSVEAHKKRKDDSLHPKNKYVHLNNEIIAHDWRRDSKRSESCSFMSH